jgi:CheY-like chemotaxis protein
MRVLVLDDEQVRHEEFVRQHPADEVVSARSVHEACAALRGPRFDRVQLDHDLGSGSPTGLEAARFIAEMEQERRPAMVIVHSHNPVGAREMVLTLRDAGVRALWMRFTKDAA